MLVYIYIYTYIRTYIHIYIHMDDRNNAVRGNVKLPELSNFPPTGKLFRYLLLSLLFITYYFLSWVKPFRPKKERRCKYKLSKKKNQTRIAGQNFWSYLLLKKRNASCTKSKSVYTKAEGSLHRSTQFCIAGDGILINGSTVFVSYLYTVVSEILRTSVVQDFLCGFLLPRNYSDGSTYFC
jgi:hypothetical protein